MSGDLIGPCPECGHKALVYRSVRAVPREGVRMMYSRLGAEMGPCWDRLSIVFYSKAIRCDRCDAIRRDLRPEGERVVHV